MLTTKWTISINENKFTNGLAFCQNLIGQYNTEYLKWIRISDGRSDVPYKLYGRCWNYDNNRYGISCQLPGPYPFSFESRRQPQYQHHGSDWQQAPEGLQTGREHVYKDASGRVRRWMCFNETQTVGNWDEALVWVFAHETFHYLRYTKQIEGRNVEWQADMFGDKLLNDYKNRISQ